MSSRHQADNKWNLSQSSASATNKKAYRRAAVQLAVEVYPRNRPQERRGPIPVIQYLDSEGRKRSGKCVQLDADSRLTSAVQ
ncbi:hypothetical protein CABS01_14077 [Colletotrichum abscissum]|uniref:uncharacterized protein n=1 Tax=Colletotrichum abscissum TaxID=1671311 RepID=UPI0027D6D2C7|nr:uncharacterized protein CABS01_14077 [Colletotrichum abscissum]KAK1482379.1 hypothetical protein CABS01_14077 [Colletotrichum abscissum]